MQDTLISWHSFVFVSRSLRLTLEDWKHSRRSQDEIIAQKHIAIIRNKETYGSYKDFSTRK